MGQRPDGQVVDTGGGIGGRVLEFQSARGFEFDPRSAGVAALDGEFPEVPRGESIAG